MGKYQRILWTFFASSGKFFCRASKEKKGMVDAVVVCWRAKNPGQVQPLSVEQAKVLGFTSKVTTINLAHLRTQLRLYTDEISTSRLSYHSLSAACIRLDKLREPATERLSVLPCMIDIKHLDQRLSLSSSRSVITRDPYSVVYDASNSFVVRSSRAFER